MDSVRISPPPDGAIFGREAMGWVTFSLPGEFSGDFFFRMKKDAWKKKTIEQMKGVGTYREEFLPTVEDLAELLEYRDDLLSQYKKEGRQKYVEKIKTGGIKDIVLNPLLTEWKDADRRILEYRRELGLTAAGLKKINEKAMKPVKRSSLAEIMNDIN